MSQPSPAQPSAESGFVRSCSPLSPAAGRYQVSNADITMDLLSFIDNSTLTSRFETCVHRCDDVTAIWWVEHFRTKVVPRHYFNFWGHSYWRPTVRTLGVRAPCPLMLVHASKIQTKTGALGSESAYLRQGECGPIRSPYPEFGSGSRNLLVQWYYCGKMLTKKTSARFFQRYEPNVERYRAMLKNPFKNSYLRIQIEVTSEI